MYILIDKSSQHLLNSVLKLQNLMQEKSKEEKCLFKKNYCCDLSNQNN